MFDIQHFEKKIKMTMPLDSRVSNVDPPLIVLSMIEIAFCWNGYVMYDQLEDML